jgi:hypothetical protein
MQSLVMCAGEHYVFEYNIGLVSKAQGMMLYEDFQVHINF